ncbi:MAG: 6-carboxytetrahydropterin synthase [Gammaproteobacteria bacterium]|nr:6-carboxytetrahydropterin synthase [Gammaproteobacteria bacterium]MDH3560457.1 6-carboxytetrahydropterin synthase [Gammaproteobacteria bacterium]
MYKVIKTVSFCYGHRLLNYQGKCQHLHGHNADAVITLESASLDARGMVVDFTDIQAVVKEWLDHELDHTLLLCRDDPVLPLLQQAGERVFVMDANPTAENIARLIFEFVAQQGFPVVEVALWETGTSCASYRP